MWPLLFLLCAAALTACTAERSASDGAWPSLAKRPVEMTEAGAPALPRVSAGAASGEQLLPAGAASPVDNGSRARAGSSAGTPAGAGSSGDLAARLATVARDVDGLEQRWRTQVAATQRAAAAARAHPDAEVRATAQLETGRLDKLAGQAADERAQLEGIAGDLAVAAAAGIDVSAPLKTAGNLLGRCVKLTSVGAELGGDPMPGRVS